MISISKIDTSDLRYTYVENLMLRAFPVDERRDLDQQRDHTDHNPLFKCCVIEDRGQAVGLLNYWDFGDFGYVEHFAIDDALRNKGYGGKALDCFISKIEKPIILEVEMPTDDLSRRRIGFYSRHGLRLWDDVSYIQPPYRAGGNALDMKLMATPPLSPADAERIRATIHHNVYNQPLQQ